MNPLKVCTERLKFNIANNIVQTKFVTIFHLDRFEVLVS